MAPGKYTRIDAQSSSRYCVTISIVMFVSTCFLGAWMSMSSSIGPLGVGMTLQQFMVGMPKKANLNNADLHGKALKMNGSRITVQDDSNLENVTPNEPQSSEVGENRESELIDGKLAENVSISPVVAEKSVLWNEEVNKGSQEKNSGSPDVVDTSNQEKPTEKYVDSTVKMNEDDNERKQVGETEANPEKLEVPTEKYVDNERKQVGETEVMADENGGKPEEHEVPTEKYADSTVQTRDGDSETKQLGETDTKVEEEVPTEKYVDSTVQTRDGDKETKQVGETEKTVDEIGENSEKIPLVWMNAKRIQDKMVNRTRKRSQKQHESDVPSRVVSNQISSQGKAAEQDKEKALEGGSSSLHKSNYSWKICNTTAGPDYIPCLDNIQSVKKLRTTSHYEHRERHCPDEAPICLVPLPKGYKTAIKWPKSRDMIWYILQIWFSNVPHTMLAEYKGGQNWVKVYDRYLTFPGGGTQFKYGALHYIDYLEQSVPEIAWGRQSRVVLDVGCGVASFGGYLFERDVLTMSVAPKDEHEAQVQFALERGIPAISAVMGTNRLPFPSMVFDVIHCARCRVPWHVEGGKLLLELNRLLRPGGYFVWSATPVYRKDSTNAAIWKDMSELTQSMCWDLVKVERDTVNRKAAAIYRKPVTNNCYEGRESNDPPLCEETDDSSSAWYTPLQSCIHKVPTNTSERGSKWPAQWPSRLDKAPYWLKGDDASWDISNDYSRWKHVVSDTYLNGSGIDWSSVRNVMDMRASYGGFAAALKDLKLWVMNVVPVNSSNTLPIIYERGLFGIYHDWCESFSTYPRSYDLLHANHLFSNLKKRCSLVAVMAEVDRILRPGGWLIIRDDTKTVSEVESIASSLLWKIKFTHSKGNKQVFCVEKTKWRPSEIETISSAIG